MDPAQQYPGTDPANLDRLSDPGLLAPYLKAVAVGGGKCAPYIEATAYRSIADRVLGAANHSTELTMVPTRQPRYLKHKRGYDGNPDTEVDTAGGTGAVARVTVWLAGREHPKVAEAGGSNASEAPDTGFKGADSDSKKRAWAAMGLGVALARLPNIRCNPKVEREVAAAVAQWKATLEGWQAKVDERRGQADGVDPAEETDGTEVATTGNESLHEDATTTAAPAVPEGHQVNPATGEVTPVDTAPTSSPPAAPVPVDRSDMQPQPPSEPAVSPTPVAAAAPSASAAWTLAELADVLKAPGVGTGWQVRGAWAREHMGQSGPKWDQLKVAVGMRFDSQVANDEVWTKVLAFLVEHPDMKQEAAA